jgi:hypothetical protein
MDMRWSCLTAAFALTALGSGCAREMDPVPGTHEEPVGRFVLQTAAGPVDVVSLTGDPAGDSFLGLHWVNAAGEHESPTVRFWFTPDPDDPESGTLTYALLRSGIETCRYSRRVEGSIERAMQIELNGSGESLHLTAVKDATGVRVNLVVDRNGQVTSLERTIDPTRTGDPDYVADVRAEMLALYPQGTLTETDDLRLLMAVMSASDWENHTGIAPAGTIDEATEKRIRQVCVTAAIVGKVSCLIARFNPWGWLLCVPAEGINAACLAYGIAQAFQDDDGPDQNPPVCNCACGCDDD